MVMVRVTYPYPNGFFRCIHDAPTMSLRYNGIIQCIYPLYFNTSKINTRRMGKETRDKNKDETRPGQDLRLRRGKTETRSGARPRPETNRRQGKTGRRER
jgi:hypothetical protein